MKRLSPILSPLACLQIISLSIVLSGCIINKNGAFLSQPGKSSTPREQQEQISQLEKKIADQKGQIIQMQMHLLEKRAEIEKLTKVNERLVREFVRNNAQSWNRRSKVETVRLIAEVSTVIKAVNETQPTGHRRDLLLKAEQHLAESRVELGKENFDGAAYLAEQAMDHIQALRLGTGTDDQQSENVIIFPVPLPMKINETCNVRENPSGQSSVKFILEAGSHVTAKGYHGQWIQVMTKQHEDGWIHQTLLSGEWE